MAYIGTQPLAGQYRKLDDISSGFNGATTSFTTSVGGTNVTAGSPQQLLVSLGGVIQQPTTDYTVNTSTIIFTTAPASGLSFFAILMGDALNTSVPADGSITSAKLAGSLSVGLAAGSASTPSLFFTGDTNTGVYSPGADQVAISTNGSGRLFVNSSGSVGIGTSSPSRQLDVLVADNTTYAGNADNANALNLFNTSTTNETFSSIRLGSQGSGSAGLVTLYGVQTANAAGSGYFAIATRNAGTFAERFRITPGGNVGIGTTSPSAPLHINGTANNTAITLSVAGTVTGYIGPAGFLGGSDSSLGYRAETGNNHAFFIGASEAARIDSSRRLLVGTSSTSVVSTVTLQGNSTNSAADAIIRFARGTSSPASGDFLGSLIFGDSSWGEAAYIIGGRDGGTWSSTSKPGRITFHTTADGASSPTERMRIGNDGYVYIKQMAVGGTANMHWSSAAGQLFVTSSSLRFKKDIVDYDKGLAEVMQMQPKYFVYNQEPGGKQRAGFIAEDFDALGLTEYVEYWKDENDQPMPSEIGYSNMVAILVKAIQELKAEVDDLKSQLA